MLYVNGEYDGDDGLGRLMHDFCESDPDAMLDELMAERVRYLKRTPKGVRQMCEIFDEIRQEGEQRGIEIGEQRSLLDSLRRLMARLNISAQEAFDILGVPEPEQPRYLALL